MVKNLNTGAYSVKRWVINETQPFDYNTLKKMQGRALPVLRLPVTLAKHCGSTALSSSV